MDDFDLPGEAALEHPGSLVTSFATVPARTYGVTIPAGAISGLGEFTYSVIAGCAGSPVTTTDATATWHFALGVPAGAYSICFRPAPGAPFETIPTVTGEREVEVERLPVDATASKGP